MDGNPDVLSSGDFSRINADYVVDAHFHVWNVNNTARLTGWPAEHEHAKIYADFSVGDYERDVKKSGLPIRKSLFVQTINRNVDETKAVIADAASSGGNLLAGVVAGVQLDNCTAEHVQEQIDEIRSTASEDEQPGWPINLLYGARHILALEDADVNKWLVREDVIHNMGVIDRNNLTFDLLVTQQQHTYATIVPMLRQYPNMHFVLDHIAKPDMKYHKRWSEWQALIDWLARLHSNVYCKISGLVTEANWENWSADDLKPYVEYAVNAFGTQRCMFASDWPVFKLVRDGTYRSVFDAFLSSLPEHCRRSRQEMEQLLHGTAERAYRLS